MYEKQIIGYCNICQDLMQGVGWVTSDAGTTSTAILQHLYPVGSTRTDGYNIVIHHHEGELNVTFMREFMMISIMTAG
jgi:hypothetical protein